MNSQAPSSSDWKPAAVTEGFSVAPQMTVEDMARAAALGFRSVINNRPDFEAGPMQPQNADLERAAKAAGLEYRYLPVNPSGHSPQDALKMSALVAELPGPVLAFCRSGRRSTALFQLGQSLKVS